MYRKFVVAAIILSVVTSCSLKPSEPELTGLKDIHIERTAGIIYLKASLVFNNPNKSGLSIADSDLDIFINQKHVADVEDLVINDIAPDSEFVVPIDVSFEPSKVFESFLLNSFGTIQSRKFNLGIQGTLSVECGKVSWPDMAIEIRQEVDASKQ